MITSALLVLNLASNASYHSSLRPKRRYPHVPKNISMHHSLKRESNVSYFTVHNPSLFSKISASKANHAPTPCLHKILTVPSVESCTEPHASSKEISMKKEETTMKKEFNVNDIFSSSRKRHSTFRKALKDKEHHF